MEFFAGVVPSLPVRRFCRSVRSVKTVRLFESTIIVQYRTK
jgi:hypothetical protein